MWGKHARNDLKRTTAFTTMGCSASADTFNLDVKTPTKFYVVHKGDKSVEVVAVGGAKPDKSIATGVYERTLETIGWDVMQIETDGSFDDAQQAFAAGYFEGFQSAFRIWPHTSLTSFWNPVDDKTVASLRESLAWLDDNLNQLKDTSEYWMQVLGTSGGAALGKVYGLGSPDGLRRWGMPSRKPAHEKQ